MAVMAHTAIQTRLWMEDGAHAQVAKRLRQAVAWSFVLHAVLFVVVLWVRLPQHGERPLASIEISLASLPTPPVKAVEPVKEPVKRTEAPAPAPPVKAAPVAPPSVSKPVAVPARPTRESIDDLFKDLKPLPDAPKFGDFSPTDKPKKAQEPAVANVNKLKLPDVPVVPDTKEVAKKPVESKPRPSLSEELNRELDEELSKIKKVELPKEHKAVQAEPQVRPTPQVDAKTPSVKSVDTTLKVSSTSPGSNAYLALVRRKISSMWSAPPVDVTAQVYTAIVRFRLNRDGSVSGVAVEQSSGNGYFDDAAKRAVINANPLPNFPTDLPDSHFDAHFTFTVGEQHG